MLYFLRVNGQTVHNNPADQMCFVAGEPPTYPTTSFDYLQYCFANDVVRIGWPDTGDLATGNGKMARCYTLQGLRPYVQQYLQTFQGIAPGDEILVPDKASPGFFHVCTVTRPYHYFHATPAHPYECAHRLGVEWDREFNGVPRVYQAWACGISIRGGFWRKAVATINADNRKAIDYGKLLALRTAGRR